MGSGLAKKMGVFEGLNIHKNVWEILKINIKYEDVNIKKRYRKLCDLESYLSVNLSFNLYFYN